MIATHPSRPRRALAAFFAPDPPSPSYPVLPARNADGETSIPGVFVVGEAAGTPLLKLGINAGHTLAQHLRKIHEGHLEPDGMLDVLVAGAGAAGLSTALTCRRLGLSVVVLEARTLASTVVDMFRGKHLYDEPVDVAVEGPLWFEACSREDLLARWQEQVASSGLDLREGSRIIGLSRRSDSGPGHVAVETSTGTILARRVVLAVGKSGPARRLGVPGEDAHPERVRTGIEDPNDHRGVSVVVVGGGDTACETAIALAAPALENTVHLVVRRDLQQAHPKLRQEIEGLVASKRLTLLTATTVVDVDNRSVHVADGAPITADLVVACLGREPPTSLWRQLGLDLERRFTMRRIALAAAVFLGVYSLYALKKYPELPYSWPFSGWLAESDVRAVVGGAFHVAFLPFRWLFDAKALVDMEQTLWFQQGYLYSLAYTVAMLVFGRQALLRWTKVAKDPTVQRRRYFSLVAFQVVFFLAANVIAVQGLSLQHAWRAWGLYQPWPLFFNTFNWWQESDPDVVFYGFVGAGLLGTFVAIPLLARNQGKRFCSYVCGCGGLAETLGDRWRHLAPKGPRSRAWEVQGLAVLVACAIVTLVTVGMYQTRADNVWAQTYAYVVDFWLVAVVPIALYPFFGGKIWCRYWCPLAAWNGVLARWYGRLGISSNDKCISCGQCSKQCQVGVDVMDFARRQERFDNRNSSCIQCGICIDVCPVSVLSTDLAPKRGALPIIS